MGDNKVPEDWSIKKIGDIGQVIGGGTPSTKDKLYYGGKIPWITPKDLSDHKFTFIERGERNITKIGLNNSSERLLPRGTVLFTSRAPIGYVAIAKNAVSTNQGFKSIICNPQKAYNKFIYYALNYYKDKIENVASGSTFKEISGTTLKNFEILLPPLDEQKVIADRLFSIDSKIELNHQMNKTLEAIGQAIFKHWFVDFEFPNEEGNPYKSSGGEMVFNEELGKEIPKGWGVGRLGEFINITSGKRPEQKSEVKDSVFNVPLVGASRVMGFVMEPLFKEPALIIGRVGTHGVVQRFTTPTYPSDNTLVIRSPFYEYVYQVLKRIDYASLNVGSTQPLITQSSIKNYTRASGTANQIFLICLYSYNFSAFALKICLLPCQPNPSLFYGKQ